MKVKTKADNRNQNWAYIPIPYFIPSPLYNNLFFNPNPPQISSVPQSAISNPFLKDPDNNSPAAVDQLENPNVKTVYRGRLTRQALKQKPQKRGKEDDKKEEEDADAVGGDEISMKTSETEVKEDATTSIELEPTASTEEMMSSVAIEMPSPKPLLTSTSSTGLSTAPSDNVGATTESFEIGEWEYLNGTFTNSQTNSKFNQTSSYYRQNPLPFDPAQVSFTTWYPVAANQDSFKPSAQYNESPFKPVSGPEPLVLPKYQSHNWQET